MTCEREPWCDALRMVRRIALFGAGPGTTPEQALETIVAYVDKKLAQAGSESEDMQRKLRHLSIVLTNGITDDATKLSIAREWVAAQRRILAAASEAEDSQERL